MIDELVYVCLSVKWSKRGDAEAFHPSFEVVNSIEICGTFVAKYCLRVKELGYK